jgi:hypothetical protein
MLQTHDQSQAMLRSVLHNVRRRMTTEQVLTFADALPPLVHFRLRRIVWTPRDHPVRHASSSYRSNKDADSPSRLDGRQFLALRLGLEKIRISYPGARRCSLWRLQRARGGADDLH